MTTWKLDNAHTQVNFSAKHMMVTTVRGTFHDVQGTIELDETDPSRSRGEFRVAAASVDTNFGARDTHLRSADFFDAETYPTIHFVSTAITQTGDDAFDVTGDLTMHGVTKEVTFDVDGPTGPVNAGRNFVVGATATTTVNRSDWGLTWNRAIEAGGVTVSDAVKITLGIEANKPNPNAPPPPPRPGQ